MSSTQLTNNIQNFQLSACRLKYRLKPNFTNVTIYVIYILADRLCGLVVRVSGYRYRGLGFDSRRYQIF